MTLNKSEIEIITKAIQLRQKTNGIDPECDKLFEQVLSKLKYDDIKLTSIEKTGHSWMYKRFN